MNSDGCRRSLLRKVVFELTSEFAVTFDALEVFRASFLFVFE